MKRLEGRIRRSAGALAALAMLLCGAGAADAATYMRIYLNESKIIRVDGLKRVSVTNPSVATPVIISPSEVMLNGLAVGRTSLYIWDAAGRTEIQVVVRPFTEELEAAIVQEIDNPDISVRLINEGAGQVLFLRGTVDSESEHQNALEVSRAYHTGRTVDLIEVRGISEPPTETLNRLINNKEVDVQVIMNPANPTQIANIILEGSVDDQRDADRAVAIATSFAAGGGITNLLEVTNPLQVMVEAHLLELVRSNTTDSGISWGTFRNNGLLQNTINFFENAMYTVGVGGGNSRIGPRASAISDLKREDPLAATFRAIEDRGLGKILENPKVVTRSGETATISVGGEVGSIVSAGFGSQAAEFRSFGLDMSVTPNVDHKGNINTQTQISLSTVDQALGATLQGSTVPGFRRRATNNTVSVKDGEHIVVSGLINREEQQLMSKVPLLWKIPVLGKLFQSKSFQKTETELVVIITPHLLASKKLRERFYNDAKTESPRHEGGGEDTSAEEKAIEVARSTGNQEMVSRMFADLKPRSSGGDSMVAQAVPAEQVEPVQPAMTLARARSEGLMIPRAQLGFPEGNTPLDPLTGDVLSPMQAPRREVVEDTSAAIKKILEARRRNRRSASTRSQLAQYAADGQVPDSGPARQPMHVAARMPAPMPVHRPAPPPAAPARSLHRPESAHPGMRPIDESTVTASMLPNAPKVTAESMAPPQVPEFAASSGSITRRIHGIFEEAGKPAPGPSEWSEVRLEDHSPSNRPVLPAMHDGDDSVRDNLDQRVDELFQQIRSKLEGGGL